MACAVPPGALSALRHVRAAGFADGRRPHRDCIVKLPLRQSIDLQAPGRWLTPKANRAGRLAANSTSWPPPRYSLRELGHRDVSNCWPMGRPLLSYEGNAYLRYLRSIGTVQLMRMHTHGSRVWQVLIYSTSPQCVADASQLHSTYAPTNIHPSQRVVIWRMEREGIRPVICIAQAPALSMLTCSHGG